MELTIRWGEKCVLKSTKRYLTSYMCTPPVTDMLVAVLNTCTKEELEESDEMISPVSSEADSAERRKVIKNKIMAVGRMSRVFALLREESEKVSELKSVSGSSKLPYGTLALGSEGIKDAITGFEDAYGVSFNPTWTANLPYVSFLAASRILKTNAYLLISSMLIQKKAKP